MTKKLVSDGAVLEIPAPSGGVSAGDFVLIGDLLCHAVTDGAAGVVTAFNVEGVHKGCPAADDVAFLVGQALYWDASDNDVTNDPDDGSGGLLRLVGHAAAAKATEAKECIIRLQPGITLNVAEAPA